MPLVAGLPPLSSSSVGASPVPSTRSEGPDVFSPSLPPSSLPPAFSVDSLEWEEWRGDWPFLHHALAGSFAGVMEHITMYPIDTLKTRMQAFWGEARASQATSSASTDSRGRSAAGLGDKPSGSPLTSDGVQGGVRPGNPLRYSTLGTNPPALATSHGRPGIPLSVQTPRGLYSLGAAASPLHWVMGAATSRLGTRVSVGGPSGDSFWRTFVGVERAEIWGQQAQALGSAPVGRRAPSLAVNSRTRELLRPPLAVRESGMAVPPGVKGWLRGAATCGKARGASTLSGVDKNSRAPLRHPGLVRGLRGVYAEGGVRSLYRGAGAVVAGCVPAHACYFMAYESVKERMRARALERRHQQQQQQQQQQQEPATAAATDARVTARLPVAAAAACQQQRAAGGPSCQESMGAEGERQLDTHMLTHMELLACGMCATLSHDLILTPVDVVKQRMQLGCFRSLTDCVTATLQREGPLAFVRSLPVSVFLNLPHGATLIYANETLKNHLMPHQPSSSLSLSVYFFCAGVSGGMAGLISNPLDVVKTRLQTQECAIRESRAALGGVAKAVSCPFAPCQPKYQGVSSRVCLSIPATAICWGSYETFKFIWRASAGDT